MSEAIAWIQSKFEIFRTSALVRNVAGQTGSTVSLSNVMREQRILLVNVSKNRPEGMYQPAILGEYNSSLIGHIVVSRMRAAVLERASLPPNERKDFFVYIDEFQNMTSDSLGALLSDARKSRVGITLSNESFSQLRAVTQDALVRGVGSRVTFRVGAQDSKPLASWLGTGVFPEDLPWLPNDTAVAALSARGESIKPFPFRTQAPAFEWTMERAQTARNSSRIWWAASTPLLDPIFFHRWAHVEGSGDARRFAERAAQLSEQVDPQPTPEPGFVEKWILNRILINTSRDLVDVHLPRGAIGILPECVRLIQRRFGFDYDRSVRIASAGEGGSIQGMTRAHATALRYELRLLGADLEITPDRADATEGHAPVDPGTISIADLGLSERPKMCLTRAKVTSVTELTSRSLADLRSVRLFGRKSLEEIIEVLAQRGLELRADPSPGGLKPNQTWLAAIGLGGLAEADQVSLLEVVQGEAEARVGRTVPEVVTDEEIREFLSTTGVDDYTAMAAVPNLGEVFAWTLDDLQSELSEAKEMILRELATNDPS